MTSRVVVLLGTRPEAIKLAPVIRQLKAREREFAVTVLNTGQHSEILDRTVRAVGIGIDNDLKLTGHGKSLSEHTGDLVRGIGTILTETNPDWAIVQGDTLSAFAGALAAFQHRIRLAHVEAGLRTGQKEQPFPEEINRRLIAPLADLNFAPTQRAREALLREGIAPQTVHVTGNTGVDMLVAAAEELTAGARSPEILSGFADDRPIVLVTVHRRENIGKGTENICAAVRQLAETWPKAAFIFPVHHNPGIGPAVDQLLAKIPNVLLVPPLDYHELIAVMARSAVVLSDSGGIQEEAPTFSVPVLVLRESTERTESLEAGYSKLVGTVPGNIIAETCAVLSGNGKFAPAPWQNPYGDGRAAERIADILASRG